MIEIITPKERKMDMLSRHFLGEVEYYGKLGKAFREVYSNNCWKFVVIIEGVRHVLITY